MKLTSKTGYGHGTNEKFAIDTATIAQWTTEAINARLTHLGDINGKKIELIRALRSMGGLGLKDAKDQVEAALDNTFNPVEAMIGLFRNYSEESPSSEMKSGVANSENEQKLLLALQDYEAEVRDLANRLLCAEAKVEAMKQALDIIREKY